MIGTGNRPALTLRFLKKGYATVATHILKHMDRTFLIARHDHRNDQKLTGLTMPGLQMSLPKPIVAQLLRNKVSCSCWKIAAWT